MNNRAINLDRFFELVGTVCDEGASQLSSSSWTLLCLLIQAAFQSLPGLLPNA